ncbi:MAG: hypothetical protein HYY06_12205 [Deltaproteobacteria bacterium]|nr:hypothetical protein [Deltaproteobacteria bacterium]
MAELSACRRIAAAVLGAVADSEIEQEGTKDGRGPDQSGPSCLPAFLFDHSGERTKCGQARSLAGVATGRVALLAALLLACAVPAAASAWDGPGSWYAPADGAQPGGGGIIGTGSARDYRITCDRCHVEQPDRQVDATFELTPALGESGGTRTYEPGRTYRVVVTLAGEFLGLSGCGQYTRNVNNFAVTFEDGTGRRAGTIESDTGQSQADCPAGAPDPDDGTTLMYGDCGAVLGLGREGLDRWTFDWTAPPAGSGAVDAFWGVVDGNCDMHSTGDAVVAGKLTLAELLASNERAPLRWPGVLPPLVATLALALAWRGRRR